MNPVLGIGEALHSKHHHVGIVVRTGVLRFGMNAQIEVREDAGETGHAAAVFAVCHDGRDDVATGAPDVGHDSTDVGCPGPGAVLAPIANGKIEMVSGDGFSPGNGPGDLSVLNCGVPLFLGAAAPVDFNVVESPPCELEEILFVVTFTPGIRIGWAKVRPHGAAAIRSGIRVDSGLQTLGVNGADNIGHIACLLSRSQCRPGLGIDHHVAVLIPFSEPPAFIDIDVLIAGLLHAGGDHGLGLLEGDLGIDGIREAVP